MPRKLTMRVSVFRRASSLLTMAASGKTGKNTLVKKCARSADYKSAIRQRYGRLKVCVTNLWQSAALATHKLWLIGNCAHVRTTGSPGKRQQ